MKTGTAASNGYAIGHILLKNTVKIDITEKKIDDVQKETERFKHALELSRTQLLEIKEHARKNVGEKEAAVFESHIMFLDDPEFAGAIEKSIEENKINAEKALEKTLHTYLEIFDSMKDEYMKERAADIKDVSKRILENLSGKEHSSFQIVSDDTIIVSHDLTPSDTAQLDKNKVVAFLTDVGGRTSHSAIMARTLEIPAVVGLKDITSCVKTGDTAIVDGFKGEVILNPDNTTLKQYEVKKAEYDKEKSELKVLVNKHTITKNGKVVNVAGNIGKPEDVLKVLENGGEGVGLFRTEFLYMNRDTMPTEEEQFAAYKYVAEKMNGKPVVIRTLDIGGDKKLSYLPMPYEMNPFLGYRAIRLCLGRTDIFKIQLRALLRASVFGNLKIMFPMISSLDEFLSAKKILKECMDDLEKEGIPFNKDLETGIMVEIPSAAIMADELAKYVDFFSIGTNDLIQYTLAADRMNEKVSYLYNPMHPAVLRLIKMTIDAAHKEGKWCGMCGEMAGDEKSAPTLVEYGLDEFSMSASSILKAKQIIMNC